jgi:hypothetical protein
MNLHIINWTFSGSNGGRPSFPLPVTDDSAMIFLSNKIAINEPVIFLSVVVFMISATWTGSAKL